MDLSPILLIQQYGTREQKLKNVSNNTKFYGMNECIDGYGTRPSRMNDLGVVAMFW